MRNSRWFAILLVVAAFALYGQRERLAPPPNTPTWEYRALTPHEISTAAFRQVEWFEVEALGNQGWELVSVTPFVIRNDEHKPRAEGESKLVTQNYVAYYFKRQRQPQK